ncbi:hypothetical protein ACWEFL_30385 [Streptomyces sp. NPDC004838]
MSAHTPTPSPAKGGVDSRLPWWALALPVLAFVLLLLMIADPAQAQSGGGDPAIARVLEHIRLVLTR